MENRDDSDLFDFATAIAHRPVDRARTRVPGRPQQDGLDHRNLNDDRGPSQDHAINCEFELARRAIPAGRLDRRDGWLEEIQYSASVCCAPVRNVVRTRDSIGASCS